MKRKKRIYYKKRYYRKNMILDNNTYIALIDVISKKVWAELNAEG